MRLIVFSHQFTNILAAPGKHPQTNTFQLQTTPQLVAWALVRFFVFYVPAAMGFRSWTYTTLFQYFLCIYVTN
jgi:hypothetical protein